MPAVPALQQKEGEEPIQVFEAPQKNIRQFAGSGEDDPTQPKPFQLKSNNTGLPGNLKSGVENLSGMDMSDVKVHYNSPQPAQLNAHAYAQGNDIHIGPGQEKHLPHEAWHVVQQRQGRVQPTTQMKTGIPVNDDPGLEHEADVMGEKALQTKTKESTLSCFSSPGTGAFQFAKPKKKKALKNPSPYDKKEGKIELNKKNEIETIELAELQVPDFKKHFTPDGITLPKRSDRPNDQVKIWENEAKKGKDFEKKLKQKLDDAGYKKPADATPYHMKIKKSGAYVVGKQSDIKDRSLRPYWDSTGKIETHDVDHKLELQLGGTNTIDNMWLLESEANRSSGRVIKQEKDGRIKKLLDKAGTYFGIDLPSVSEVRDEHDIKVNKVLGGLAHSGNAGINYELSAIKKGDQLEGLKVLDDKEIESENLAGKKTQLVIYTNSSGGGMKHVDWDPKGDETQDADIQYGKYLQVESVTFDTKKNKGSMLGKAFVGSAIVKNEDLEFDIQKMNGVKYGGFIPKFSVDRAAKRALKKAKKLSLVEMDSMELTENGLYGEGRIITDIPLISGATIKIKVEGNKIFLYKDFNPEDFHLPKPFIVKRSTLVISATDTLSIGGRLEFEVENMGSGYIEGSAEGAQLSFSGVFKFDSNLFDEAEMALAYEKGGDLTGAAKLKIAAGKVPGLKEATVTASYRKNKLEITGKATAEILPGVTSGLNINYNNGAITIEGWGTYKKGMLDGNLAFGFTNRVIDENGNPTSTLSDHFTPYGSGMLKVKLMDNLEAEARAKLLRNGEVEMRGAIGISQPVNLFDRKSFEKKLLDYDLKVPVFGVSVGPFPIGLFGKVGGKAAFFAGIGPARINKLSATAFYNPSHEDKTILEGEVGVELPAEAGIKFTVPLGLSLDALIASLEGRMDLEGLAKIVTTPSATAKLKWTPIGGLEFEATPEVEIKSSLTFDVNAVVAIILKVLGWEGYRKEWVYNILKKDFGSPFNYKMAFPIRYKERGGPLTMSIDDINPSTPEVSIEGIAEKAQEEAFGEENAKEGKDMAARKSQLMIYTNSSDNIPRKVDWEADSTEKTMDNLPEPMSKHFKVTKITYKKGAGGTITGNLFESLAYIKSIPPITFAINEIPGQENSVVIDNSSIISALGNNISIGGIGIVTLKRIGFDDSGLTAAGTLTTTDEVIKGIIVDFTIKNDEPSFRKEFKSADLKGEGEDEGLFKITQSSFVMYTEGRTVKAGGDIDFEVGNLGAGKLTGSFSLAEKLKLTGEFSFDKSKVDSPKYKLTYADLSFRGEGPAKLNILGLNEGVLFFQFRLAKDRLGIDTVKVGGTFGLGNMIPGTSGGSVTIEFLRKEGKFEASLKGTATPNIPGVTGEFDVQYANNALTLILNAPYEYGKIKGNVKLGVTNQNVDETGKLTGSRGEKFRVFGGGDVKFTLIPQVDTIVGVQFLPNGEPEVNGTIRLAQPVTLFEPKKFKQEPSEIDFTGTLIGLTVWKYNIGLIGKIAAGMESFADIGPGRIEEISANFKYNPYQENTNTLNGKARLALPSTAALRIYGTIGLGTGALVASVTGNLEFGVAVLAQMPVSTEATLGWMGGKGLVMDANAQASAEARLKGDVTSVLEISVAIYGTTKWNKTLKEKYFGSGMRLGIKFPVRYEAGKGFVLSLRDVEIIKQNLNLLGLFKDAAAASFQDKKEKTD